jgi:uncharacterized protein
MAVKHKARELTPGSHLSGQARRARVLAWMKNHQSPIRGTELAKHFRVSRQCMVQDIAILRARGEDIMATPRGYRLPMSKTKAGAFEREVLACRHAPEQTEEELQILVDNGVKVLDVIVEHAIYGELRGSLMLESRADVQDFLEQVRGSNASLLSELTKGVHLHTVEASRSGAISRAKSLLRARGFLLR